MADWLRRKIVAWLLPEIGKQQGGDLRAQIKIVVAEDSERRVRELPARIREAQLRAG